MSEHLVKLRRLSAFAPILLLGGLVAFSVTGLVRAGGQASSVSSHSGLVAELIQLAPYLLRVTAGAAVQAALSTAFSLVIGTLLALVLTRRVDGRWRRLLMSLFWVAAAAPAIVIVFGMASVHGRSGWLAMLANSAGLAPPPTIYGLHGIVLAHVAMNAPFVTRAVLQALENVPGERLRLCAALGFGPLAMLRHVDWPVLRRELPGLAALVFLLCFTSFAVVLTLGGGPRNATLEVAIYQALRIEVDFARAGLLAMVQLLFGLGFVLMLGRSLRGSFESAASERGGAGIKAPRPDADVAWLRWADRVFMVFAMALVLPPVLASLAALPQLPKLFELETMLALVTSTILALLAGCIAVVLGLWLAMASRPDLGGQPNSAAMRTCDIAALALMGLPPFAFVTGLYINLRGLGSLELMGFVLLPLVNGLVALPFAYRLIQPPLMLSAQRHGRLAASLGLEGWNRFHLLDWPTIRRPAAAAFALAAAFSLGDFGVIALFGGGDLVTLPSLLASRLGAYRMDEAGAVALIMLALVSVLAHLADGWGRAADA